MLREPGAEPRHTDWLPVGGVLIGWLWWDARSGSGRAFRALELSDW